MSSTVQTVPAYHIARAPRRQLSRGDLSPLFVVAQCLDDQWVPAPLLRTMLEKGKGYADVAKVRNRYVRTEYRRALVNAPQLVVNRAYVYNTPVVLQDYARGGDEHGAFRQLLEAGAIAVFLYDEKSPTDKPGGHAYNEKGFAAWTKLCDQVEPTCVRLGWDDEENKQTIDRLLTRRFSGFASRAWTELDFGVLAEDLGLPASAAVRLQARLSEVARYHLDIGPVIKRTDIYRKFVNVDGTRPDEGRFDPGKEFAAEIKQLVDLNYNVNLPDALNGFALTPSGALPRTTLQELEQARKKRTYTADDLVKLIRDFRFSAVQEALVVKSMADLTLRDVVDVRGTDEWLQYVAALQSLVASQEGFAVGAMEVYRQYAALAQRMTGIVRERRVGRVGQILTRWQPGMELVIDVGGKAVSAKWGQSGEMMVAVSGQLAKQFVREAVPVVARLIIRGYDGVRHASDLAMSADIFTGTMERADEQLKEIEAQFRRHAAGALPERMDANINVPQSHAE